MSNSEALQKLLAPLPNYDNIPTINVCNHEVPLPAYWRILELLEKNKKEQQIIGLIVQESGFKTQRAVADIVKSIADNQRQLDGTAVAAKTSAASKPNRLSIFLSKKPKRVSAYRASRLEAQRDLNDAESKLDGAQKQEKQLLHTALVLARRKEKINNESNAGSKSREDDERRKTVSAIDHEIKKTLQRHAEIETEIEYSKRLTVIHKASLA